MRAKPGLRSAPGRVAGRVDVDGGCEYRRWTADVAQGGEGIRLWRRSSAARWAGSAAARSNGEAGTSR